MPPPRWHLLRCFGVLSLALRLSRSAFFRDFPGSSSHSSLRRLVVPKPPPDATANKPPPARGDQLELLGECDDAPVQRKRWAWMLAHVFQADMDHCPRCSGPMRRASRCSQECWAEVARTRAQITRLLAEHGLGPRAPPVDHAKVRLPEQLVLGFGKE